MELITRKVPLDFNYFLFGDVHEGSAFRHKRGCDQLIDHMRTKIDGLPVKNNLGFDHGDMLDAIDPIDYRYDAATVEGFILEQMERATRFRIPIKDQLVAIVAGTHDLKKRHFGDITKEICTRLGVPYGGWPCKVTFTTRGGNYLFKHFATHGKKAINSTADDPARRRTNKLLILKRHLKGMAADCVLMSKGHTHWCDRLKPERDVYFADDGKEVTIDVTGADHTAEYIHPDLRWYVSTGSFLKKHITNAGLISYAEFHEYDPLRLGYQLCKVRGGRIAEIEPVWVD